MDLKKRLTLLKDEFYKLKEKVFEKIDTVCYAGLSVSGEGYYLIIKIEKPERHKEYFEFIKEWIKYDEDINIDESCKDVARLRLFSVDDNPYINEKATVLRESFLREVKKPSTKIQHSNTDIDKLVKKIEASGVSIAPKYDQYIRLAIVFANELGENGRDYFHRVCSFDSKYDFKHCDKTFTDILNKKYSDCSVGTLIYYMQERNII